MIPKVKRFDRGDHWLVIDTTSGKRISYKQSKNALLEAPSHQPKPVKESTYRKPVNRSDCIHIIGYNGAEVVQTDCGCSEKTMGAWECELYNLCAPMARGTVVTPNVRQCKHCKQYAKR